MFPHTQAKASAGGKTQHHIQLKSDIAKIKPVKFLLTIRGKTQDLMFVVCGRVPGMLESRYGKGCTRFPPFPRPGGPTITCSSSSESGT
jgi:hypothetical protein